MLALDHILDFPDRFARDIPHPFDMLRNKQQPVRIDMAMLDKATSLLWAAAGIARVHEAALVVHETVQVAAGTRQALAEVVGRHLQDLAADGIAGPQDLPEREDQSLLAIEAQQHSHGAAILGFLDQNRQRHGYAFGIGQISVRRAINRRSVIGKRSYAGLCAAALHVQDMIGGNAVQPCAELALTLERAEFGDDFDEHFLGHFLGILRLKDHAHSDVVDPCLVPQNQLLQRGTVAILGLLD